MGHSCINRLNTLKIYEAGPNVYTNDKLVRMISTRSKRLYRLLRQEGKLFIETKEYMLLKTQIDDLISIKKLFYPN